MIFISPKEKPYVFEAFDKQGIPYKKKHLIFNGKEAGDFGNDRQSFTAEKKLATDLVATIKDQKKFKNQNFNIVTEAPGDKYLIIEGNWYEQLARNWKYRALIESRVIMYAATYKMSIIPTMDAYQTARLVRWMDLKSDIDIPAPEFNVWKSYDYRISILRGFPKIGEKIAERLLNKFGSIENIFAASVEELSSVPRMGDIIARTMKLILRGSSKSEIERGSKAIRE